MIVKSMTRKDASFEQIMDYLDKGGGDDKYNLYHNFDGFDKEDILSEFLENSKHVKYRKNGIYMYHEVLSLSKSDKISREKQKDRLREVVQEYIKARASKSLVYGVLHDDKDNLHYHIVFSSNEIGKSKKIRISQGKFKEIKKESENYVLEKHQELEQKKVMQIPAEGPRLSQKGWELKRRTGRLPQKERVVNGLMDVFKKAETKQDFFDRLQKNNLEFNEKGKTISFIDLETGKPHRIKTLGLESQFQAMSQKIELEQVRNKNQQKSDVGEKLIKIFETVRTKQEFFDELQKNNVEIKIRGKTISFIDQGTRKPHRLKTLGLESQFQTMSHRIELEMKQTKATDRKQSKEQIQKQYREAQGQKEHVKTPHPQDEMTDQETKKQEESHQPKPSAGPTLESEKPASRIGGKQQYQEAQARQKDREQKYKQSQQEEPQQKQKPQYSQESQKQKNQAKASIQTQTKSQEKHKEQVVSQKQEAGETQEHQEKVQRAREELRVLRELRQSKNKTKTKTKK